MTALAGGPTDDTQVLAAPAAAPVCDVPLPAPDTLLLGTQLGSGYVVPPSLVRRSDGQVLQLTPLLYAVLEAIDGHRSYDEVARVAGDAVGKLLAGDDVRTLADAKLRPLGLVLQADGCLPPLARANPLLALRPRFVVSKPSVTRRVTAPFALLFNPVLMVVVTIAFAAVAFWVLFEKGLASAAYEAFQRPGLLLAVFGITVVSAGFHEFGHAAALRRAGGTPGAMGAGLYLIWPAFFTEVTDSYRLSRAQRLRVDIGGLYFNAIVALAMFGIWEAVRWDGLLLVVAAQILQMIRQLPPLVRFDGYHLLADLTGVPDLFHRIGPTLRSFLPRRWRHSESRALRPWVRVVVTLWVLLVVPLLLVGALLTVLALPRILGTTAHNVSVQGHALLARASAGDASGAAVKALCVLALVIPVGGMLFMFVRAGRSYGLRIWRRTAGRPAQRATACIAMLAIVAGLAYAWWPHRGTYRPIEPYERGTVQDALPMPVTEGLHAGREQSAQTVWLGSRPLPTRDAPALAVVLRPKSGSGPTWVFPFNRPGPPGPGDNQAMSIVTRDGGSAYDVAFALVWADHDVVLNRNEAYAFASCRSCRAVAISFQVVLVVGQAHVVAPQNLAAAVNYRCITCVAQALATQLVVSVPADMPAQTRQRLEQLWSQIRVFERSLRHLTFAQIQQRIRSYEQQILTIVRPDLATAGPAATASASAGVTEQSSTAGTQPSSDATATATTSEAPVASTSPSPSPSASASESPAPTPTGSGSSTP